MNLKKMQNKKSKKGVVTEINYVEAENKLKEIQQNITLNSLVEYN